MAEARDEFMRRVVLEEDHRAAAVATFLGCEASNVSRALRKG